MKLQSQMLELNSKKMKNTMKPMMASFLIIIPIFVWLFPTLYGDLNVELDDSFNGVIKFEGIEKDLYFNQDDSLIKINGEDKSTNEIMTLGDSNFIFRGFDKDKNILSFKRVVVNFPFSWPFWGSRIGWLGWYIFLSMPLATVFRKLLGIVQ